MYLLQSSAKVLGASFVSPHVGVGLQEGVDAVDDPAKEAAVQGLGHGVADVGSFVYGVGADDGLAPGDHALGGQRLLELLGPDAEEEGGCGVGGNQSGSL